MCQHGFSFLVPYMHNSMFWNSSSSNIGFLFQIRKMDLEARNLQPSVTAGRRLGWFFSFFSLTFLELRCTWNCMDCIYLMRLYLSCERFSECFVGSMSILFEYFLTILFGSMSIRFNELWERERVQGNRNGGGCQWPGAATFGTGWYSNRYQRRF